MTLDNTIMKLSQLRLITGRN